MSSSNFGGIAMPLSPTENVISFCQSEISLDRPRFVPWPTSVVAFFNCLIPESLDGCMIWVPRRAASAATYLLVVAILADSCKLPPVDDEMLVMVISITAEIFQLIKWASPLCAGLPDEMQAVAGRMGKCRFTASREAVSYRDWR